MRAAVRMLGATAVADALVHEIYRELRADLVERGIMPPEGFAEDREVSS
jgi:hypothetical protein